MSIVVGLIWFAAGAVVGVAVSAFALACEQHHNSKR